MNDGWSGFPDGVCSEYPYPTKTHGKAKGDSGILHTANRECSLSSRVGVAWY